MGNVWGQAKQRIARFLAAGTGRRWCSVHELAGQIKTWFTPQSVFVGGQLILRSVGLEPDDIYWPQMNADKRGFDSLTERVLAAFLEVSNILGAGRTAISDAT